MLKAYIEDQPTAISVGPKRHTFPSTHIKTNIEPTWLFAYLYTLWEFLEHCCIFLWQSSFFSFSVEYVSWYSVGRPDIWKKNLKKKSQEVSEL